MLRRSPATGVAVRPQAILPDCRAAELGADDAWPLNNAGYALLVSGEHARAVSFLEQAVERNETHAVMWNNLALAREGLGDLAAAAEAEI